MNNLEVQLIPHYTEEEPRIVQQFLHRLFL